MTICFQHRFKIVWEVWGGRGGLGSHLQIFSDRTWLGSAKGLSTEHVMLRACPSCSLTDLSLHFLVAALTGRAAATNFNEVHEIDVHGNQELSRYEAPDLRPTFAKVLPRQSVQLAVGIRNHQTANMPRMLEHPQGGSMCTIYAQCAVTFFDVG